MPILQRLTLQAFAISIVFSGSFGLISFYVAIAFGGAFALVTALRSAYRQQLLPDKWLVVCFGMLAGLSTASALWAIDPSYTWPIARRTVALTMIVTGTVWFLSEEADYRLFLRAVTTAGALGSAVMAIAYLVEPGGRSEAIGGPNAVGVILGSCFLAAFLLFHVTGRRLVLIQAAMIGTGILLTLSVRTLVFVTVVIGLFSALQVSVALLRGRFAMRTLGGWLAIGVVLLSLGGGVVLGAGLGRMVDRTVGGEGNVARVAMFFQGVQYAVDSAPWGVGFGNSRWFFDRDWGMPTYTHNTYLELMIGGGFPALALYLLLLGTVGARAVRRMANGSRIGGPFALAYVVGVAALGWTMDLYTNVMTMVMIAFLYRLAAAHGGAFVLEVKAPTRDADGVATPGAAGPFTALPRG